MQQLNEDKRQELINKSKHADNYVPSNQGKGKNRYERRLHQRTLNSVREFNAIDMNQFFKENILVVFVNVQGETAQYQVQIKFGGVLDEIHDQLKDENAEINLKIITRALVAAFNSDNVYIRCTCPDYHYRFSYWSRVNDVSADPEDEEPTNGRYIVNPDDTKGRGCKHILRVISENRWLRSVAAVIYNYINYMQKHYPKLYADIIYPALFEKEYEEPVQLSIDDIENTDNTLDTSSDEIDTSNKWARTRGQFQKGNEYRFTPNTEEEVPGQKQFDFDSLVSD